MKQIKKLRFWLVFLLAAALLPGLAGCGAGKSAKSVYYIYYLNQDMTGLELVEYEPEADPDNTEEIMDEFLDRIKEGSDQVEYQQLYPDSVELVDYAYNEDSSRVLLYFNPAYSEMSVAQEVLSRQAIVETLLQIPDVTGVLFFVGTEAVTESNRERYTELCEPLTDANGSQVGVMTLDSFLDNPGEEINDIQIADLTLYFASEDGTSLVRETQHVYYYSSNISMEKLVMEQLMEGPNSNNAQSAIPEGTGLISVSVLDGVCVVNLDSNFLTQNYDIQESVVIYSIVNSLSELSTVDTVQIAVNGDSNLVYRQDMLLSEFYTMNRDLITEEGADVEVDQESQSDSKEGLLNTGE
ncbi:MAG: GerMN domain-containing protein [Clostridiales bacterium]|nr:GerMN domain-containing protein [Clostridiales bacterium]